jgi:hypothetical protein
MASPPRLYPTDLTDAESIILEPLVPAPKLEGTHSSGMLRISHLLEIHRNV